MADTENRINDVDAHELREHIDELTAHAAALRECGEQANFPAIERNAKRIEDTVAMLDMNVPAELQEE
jgi:hypothetical protein